MKPPKSVDMPGVIFDPDAIHFELGGKDYWARRMSVRATRDFVGLLHLDEDLDAEILTSQYVDAAQTILRDEDGQPPEVDTILDDMTPREILRMIQHIFGTDEQ